MTLTKLNNGRGRSKLIYDNELKSSSCSFIEIVSPHFPMQLMNIRRVIFEIQRFERPFDEL